MSTCHTGDLYIVLDMVVVCVQAQVTIDVEDLEADASPEDLMLSYVSGEKGKVGLAACLRLFCFAMTCSLSIALEEWSGEVRLSCCLFKQIRLPSWCAHNLQSKA